MKLVRILLSSLVIALVGCSSSDKLSSSDYQDEVAGLNGLPLGAEGRVFKLSPYTPQQVQDIQYALNARGLYWTAAQTPAYLNGQVCPIDVYAHRGHYNYPENSSSAVLMGALGGFDGVEIDVMLTRDGYWVVHHDSYTGRATGRSDGKRYRMSRIKGKEWNTLVVRDKDGQLTNERAPYAIDAFQQWANSYHLGQQLNIEIKEDADIVELNQLLRMARESLPQGSYFFSSLEFDVLKKMRELDKHVYLGYVWEPHPTSIAKAKQTARKAAKSDVLYQKYNRQINWVSDYEARKRSRSKSQKYSAKTVRKALGANSGLHVDIRSFVGASTIYTRSHQAGLKRVATYSINGTDYHQSQLAYLKSRGRQLPDEAIMDTSKFEACHRLYPNLAAKARSYQPTTEYGRAIMKLPNDADFNRLEEQLMYLEDNHYITSNGKVRSMTRTTSAPVKVTSKSGSKTTSTSSRVFIPEDEDLSLEAKPINIEIPN
ncbi:glycerophosphodiester phosphodiesterase [Vibrio sp. LaRot3]|uniref:glycerophosphodiester phosphodiesterase n=1 Tax=Vibrio sp. LaRot3 TaxID=2998829 RepID=UPI0022CDC635|nr:glycerophosphodiester phosphodiesterase [Vibrio sp. LaRot3]MDA0147076.1 glycerophosphodiester phosphodiesterase [Vibrio sp. LaRot3]